MDTPTDLDTLAKRLRFARNARGLGSRELARAAGLKSESHPSLIESGAHGRENVDATVASKLAQALRVNTDWLIQGGPTPKDLAKAAAAKGAA